MKRKILALLLLVAVMLSLAASALAATPVIKKTEYEGNGYVEVEFKKNVQYKNAKVSVKDASGKSYKVSKIEKDNDEVEVRVKGLKKGVKYTVTVSGVRAEGASGYGSASKSFTA